MASGPSPSEYWMRLDRNRRGHRAQAPYHYRTYAQELATMVGAQVAGQEQLHFAEFLQCYDDFRGLYASINVTSLPPRNMIAE